MFKTVYVVLLPWAAAVATAAPGDGERASAAEVGLFAEPAIYGAAICATSGCHGGAEPERVQFVIWSQRDAHSRAYATLATARSARMAEALGIADPTTSTRCTTCHAPLQAAKSTSSELLDAAARVTEGVSCVSCHGAGGDWVRSHPRRDFDHAMKAAAGLKELRDVYARANTCVACHQDIEPELLTKGKHPRLIFELDGQTASQPRHWREHAGYNGAQAWAVGQAVALREISRALAERASSADAEAVERWEALRWVLRTVNAALGVVSGAGAQESDRAVSARFAGVQREADEWARAWAAAGTKVFSGDAVMVRLKALAGAQGEFETSAGGSTRRALAYRAERLVLAVDRLWAALPETRRPAGGGERIDALFKRVQSIPDFDPEGFARELGVFGRILP